MILVDTSVWIEFFNRPKGAVAQRLRERILGEESLCINAVVEMELLQGVRNEKHFSEMRSRLAPYQYFPTMDKAYFETATDIFRACRKRGITIRQSLDCVIAANCLHHGLTLLHHDRDFEKIAKVFSKLSII